MDINTIIQRNYESCKDMKMDPVDNTELVRMSTPFCQLLWLSIGLNPESVQYGDMLGGFLYKPNNRIFAFRYHIHRPNQGSSNLSNKMTDLSEIVEKTYKISGEEITITEHVTTGFGHRAFWLHTPMSALESDDEKQLRHLMNYITRYSREQDFCRRLRKTDKKHVAYMSQFHDMVAQ